MTDRKAYIEKTQAKLNQWDSEIENLKAKAAESKADAKIEIGKQIKELEALQHEAQGKLDDLRNTAGDKWIDLKFGVEKAYDDFNRSIDKAIEKIAA